MVKSVIINLLKLYGIRWLGMLVAIIPMHIFNGVEKQMDAVQHERTMYTIMFVFYIITVVAVLLIFNYKEGEKSQKLKTSEIIVGTSVPIALHIIISIIARGAPAVTVGDFMLMIALGVKRDTVNEALFLLPSLIPPILICSFLYASAMFGGYFLGKRKRNKEIEKMKAESGKME